MSVPGDPTSPDTPVDAGLRRASPPTPEQMAAIVAAVELTWPRTVAVPVQGKTDKPSAWWYSTKPWATPPWVRRQRPVLWPGV